MHRPTREEHNQGATTSLFVLCSTSTSTPAPHLNKTTMEEAGEPQISMWAKSIDGNLLERLWDANCGHETHQKTVLGIGSSPATHT